MNGGQDALRVALRKLWTDHVVWTRCYVIAAVAGAPDAGAAAGRLLKNQDDIGDAIVPFYGREAGTGLTDLLKQHIMIAVDLIEAAKSGDQAKFGSEDRNWSDNVRQIARFLSGANPNWPEDAVYDLLDLHLRLTKGEVTARIQRDWDADVKAFDDIHNEILVVADTLAEGIAKQFPDKVR